MFYVGEFLGVVFLFAGFAVSAQVLGDVRVPFTGIVLLRRGAEPPQPITEKTTHD
jgi:hypothetical protein